MKNAWRSYGWGCALIVVVTVAAYFPTLRAGFVYDDYPLLLDNPLIKAGDGVQRFWFTTQPPDYYPVTWSMWWLEWHLWGDHAMGYHVVNILLHTVNSVLLLLILRRLKISLALLAALIFAVHPVNVATVAWISEQKNTLSMFFLALAVLWYLEFYDTNDRTWLGFSLLAFLLALLSKTAVVMLPFVLLGCLWWRRGRIQKRDLACIAPFFTLSLALGFVTVWFQSHRALAGESVPALPLPTRFAMAGFAPWFYLSKTILPLNLMVIYPRWSGVGFQWGGYLSGLLLLGVFCLFWGKRDRWGRALLFGMGCFVVMLFPVLGFFNQGFYRYSFVADHWQYYSIIGVIALMVATGERICQRVGRQGRYWGGVAAVTVLLVLGAATWRRGHVYADDVTLWRDNVARNPAPWTYNDLGCALQRTGEFTQAIQELGHALQLKTDFAEAHCNLGNVLSLTSRIEEAMEEWKLALRFRPDFAQAHYNLGLGFARQGKLPEAMGHWEQALRIKPHYAEAHYNLGVALEQTGKATEAIQHYQEALQIRPDYAQARARLARLQATP